MSFARGQMRCTQFFDIMIRTTLCRLPSLLALTALALSGCSSLFDIKDNHEPGKVTPEFVSFVRSQYPEEKVAKPSYPRFKMVLTPEVTRQIQHFADHNRRFIIKSYNNQQRYLVEVTELFQREGVPVELISVGAVESGFDPKAVSYQGAAGIWQFMKPTARSYNLNVTLFRDERKDPVKSSWAAARHLADLYDEFNDWNLALAAYNAGSGSVRKAIRNGKTRDFWTLARRGHFKRQTAEYVPRVIAMSIIMKDLNEYGFVEVAGEFKGDNTLLSYNK